MIYGACLCFSVQGSANSGRKLANGVDSRFEWHLGSYGLIAFDLPFRIAGSQAVAVTLPAKAGMYRSYWGRNDFFRTKRRIMIVKLLTNGAAAVVFCMMLIAANPLSAGTLADKREILRLEEVQTKAWLRHDWATISMMVADDFQYWSFKGIRRNKDDLRRTLEQSREGDTKIEDPEVRVYGDAAVFTARILDTEKLPNGQTHAERTCVTDVFIRRAGKWRLVASHETPLTEDK